MVGGGKDSLLTYDLANNLDIVASTSSISFNEYGEHDTQHRLIGRLMDALQTGVPHEEIRVTDQFVSGEVWNALRPDGINSRISAETPLSAFISVPVALTRQCQYVIYGHESSADTPNLFWDAENEGPVNHQWGKSQESEEMLHSFIDHEFGVGVASGLAGVSETAIFQALNRVTEHLPQTHSCNVKKPWCLKCPKCCYIYLGIASALPSEITTAVFGDSNPLDDTDNILHFRQLFGLENQTPFECVGGVDDSLNLLQSGLKRKRLSGAILEDPQILSQADHVTTATPSPVDNTKLRGPKNLQEAITEYFQ